MLTAESVAEAEAALVMPGTEPGPEEDEERPVLGWMASDVDALKHRSFTACTPDELAALRRIMTRMRLTPPRRRTRRTRPATGRGTEPDLRATIRESMRMHGEPPGQLFFRQRKTKLRPLILILDVSGSMADYSRHLLQFAHTARHAAARVEVFCFGTRLTRITQGAGAASESTRRSKRRRGPWWTGTAAPGSASRSTRSSGQWGRGGLCRGGVVVICSDGLDRGDPEVLALAMERLARLCHRIVWLNPHKGDNRDFRPSTLGMMVAAPHIDLLLSGHDLASLEELAENAAGAELSEQESTVRWSVGIEAEGDRVFTREEVVELADAVAASERRRRRHRHQPVRRPAARHRGQPRGRDRRGDRGLPGRGENGRAAGRADRRGPRRSARPRKPASCA